MKVSSPWAWVPTLYLAEGIPYFLVNVVSVTMFKRLGMGNAELALYTSLLYLPWVIKPLWSPLVDIFKSKRWWIVAMQALMWVAFAVLALTVLSYRTQHPLFVVILLLFYLAAFASATHDIAADGFYMLALDAHNQSVFVGIRSTFYRIASVFGQGGIIVLAGVLETRSGDIPKAWCLTLLCSAAVLALLNLWHAYALPRCEGRGDTATGDNSRCEEDSAAESIQSGLDRSAGCNGESGPTRAGSDGAAENASAAASSGQAAEVKPSPKRSFIGVFASFFKKKNVWLTIAFLLLFRLPEALSVKMLTPFMLDAPENGGLGLSTAQSGLVYGTAGIIALTVGGILGGLASARWGLRKALWPMAMSLALPCAVYLLMSVVSLPLWAIYGCVVLDQFGYGFGFTAYMLYMMYFSEGEFKTAHYAICSAFMALSMMLPGLVAGFIQEPLGYPGFFAVVMGCCLLTVAVTAFLPSRIDATYGRK